MLKTIRFFLCAPMIVLGCKSTKDAAPAQDPITDVSTAAENKGSVKPSPTEPAKTSQGSTVSNGESGDHCVTDPDLYHRENGLCVLIPMPSVEGLLDISAGVIWKPDLTRCRRPWSNGSFRFCSGGVHASILLPKPVTGSGRVRFSLAFNCQSLPAENALLLSIGDDSKLVLASVLTDSPIILTEIIVDAANQKKVDLNFSPNYNATYPSSCKLILVESKLVN